MKSVCVFCGSSSGKSNLYLEQAKAVGNIIAKKKMRLVYGGASIGLMGAVADAALEAKTKVLGVIPFFITNMEFAHKNLDELIEVRSMHERKKIMYDESDYFVAIPGGIGTLDELCEIATWQQLGLHRKPIFVLNVSNFFDFFIAHLDKCVEEGFLSQAHRGLFQEIKSLESLEQYLTD